MAKPYHSKKIREGVEAWNAYVEKQCARNTDFRPDLSNAKLEGADLRGAYLVEADLRGAYLVEADLEGADLRGAYLVEADLRGAYLVEADLRGANLEGADLVGAKLVGAKLGGADLRGAKLGRARLGVAYLVEAKLGVTYLEGADLVEANLGGADLVEANLRGAKLGRADLEGADLEGADLRGANLEGADLGGANLRGAKLGRAKLGGANLRGANLEGANVRSVTRGVDTNDGGTPLVTDLTAVRNLSQVQLDTMFGDDLTKIPEGLTRPEHWEKYKPAETETDQGEDAGEDDATGDAVAKGDEIDISDRIFLSYKSEDRQQVSTLKRILEKNGVPIWWDQDIGAGKKWRKDLPIYLESAAGVLTIWTEKSVESEFVIEESEAAKKAKKLVPVRMEKCKIPFGFSEVQGVDLSDWDGDASASEIKKIVNALKAFLKPPTPARKKKNIAANSKAVWVLEGGTLKSYPRPPGPVERLDEEDLADRLTALQGLCAVVTEEIEAAAHNFNKEQLDKLVSRYLGELTKEKPSWYMLDDRMHVIRNMMHRDDAKNAWSDALFEELNMLVHRHLQLAPFMRAKQPSAEELAKIEASAPLANITGYEPDELQQVATHMATLSGLKSARLVLDPTSLDLFGSLSQGLVDALNADDFNDEQNDWKSGAILDAVVTSSQRFSALTLALAGALKNKAITHDDEGRELLAHTSEILDALLKFYE